jgi:hypothetical protein
MPPSRPQVASGTSALQRPISISEPTIFKRSINLSGDARRMFFANDPHEKCG